MRTKFGTAKVNKEGYLVISSTKEGNCDKLLHRLVFEDFYKIKLPEHIIIHHDDGDKTNNEIWNLIPLTRAEHNTLHKTGVVKKVKSPMKPKSDKRKVTGEDHHLYGKPRLEESMIKQSETRNSTGYFRVNKQLDKTCKQGFIYHYRYYENGKTKVLSSVNIKKLEAKVKAKGLKWLKFEKGGLIT